MDQRAERMQISADSVLDELQRVALHEVKDIQGTTKVRALELLGRHLNLWDKDESKSPRVQIVPEGKDLEL